MSNLQKIVALIVVIIIGVGGLFLFNSYRYEEEQGDDKDAAPSASQSIHDQIQEDMTTTTNNIDIIPISHATAVLKWGDVVIYTDPVGGALAFEGQPKPDIVLITDIHGDHFDTETLNGILVENTALIVPQAVADQLPDGLAGELIILGNDETTTRDSVAITAIPMYNLPEKDNSFHTKGRGNGYVIERAGERVYIAGDTEDIPEMRDLKDIDIAFIPMNLPFTMTVESAADAVLEFQPKQVYPYHYRGREGQSDVGKFKRLVNDGNADIEVVQLNWYPEP